MSLSLPVSRQAVVTAAALGVALLAPGFLRAQTAVDSFNPGANGFVRALALQPDGKILVGGYFTAIGAGGGTAATPRNRIARLNPDGSVDATFNPGADNPVYTLALQPDGKILVGGAFTALGGGTGTTPRSRIGRLNPDGSLDMSFDPGASNFVYALAVQPDGKILVGGDFTTLGGGGIGTAPRQYIGRINGDGSIDPAFNPGASNSVFALLPRPDGKILVGGNFATLGGGGAGTTPRAFLARLNEDGTLDAGFNPGPGGLIWTIHPQPDGKFVVGGGNFANLGGGDDEGPTRDRLGRLNADGTFDQGFAPSVNNQVYALALQKDGKILVGGSFSMLGGSGSAQTSRNRLARLNADGTMDATFNPGANNIVYSLVVQPDGKILVGGYFTMLGGGGTGTTARNRIGRIGG